MNDDQLKHAHLLREAFNEYLDHIHELPLDPQGKLLSYDFDFLEGRKWTAFGGTMVHCDLRELTNIVNGWSASLRRWHAWNKVLESRAEMEAWNLRKEFLESLVHKCLITPASIRDAITSVATSALHQVRLSIDPLYPDWLEGEPKTPDERSKPLNRRQKEKRLSRLLQAWPTSANFFRSLCEINTKDYVAETWNYRNYSSHSIGPRLGIGHTRTVTRYVEQARALKEEHGYLVSEDLPGKMTVSYGFGGTPPLDLEIVRAANLIQYEKARVCYIEYRSLLEEVVRDIEPVGIE